MEKRNIFFTDVLASTDAGFINLLWKSDWAEKLFETVIQQTEREKSENLSHLADLQVFAQGEISNEAGLWRQLKRAGECQAETAEL